MKFKNLLFILSLILCAFAFDSTAQQKQFRVVGYFPNWKNPAQLVNKTPYSKVTHINYAFQNPDAQGNLTQETSDGLTELVQKAHVANVKVFVSLGGGAVAEDDAMIARYKDLCSSAKVAGFIQKIVAYIDQYNLDGVDIDLEGPAIDTQTYPGFISKLVVAMHAKNKLVTAALSKGYGAEDSVTDATIKEFDWVNVMAYDLTGPWDTSNPGPHSPYDWSTQQLTYFKGRNGNVSDKVVLGIPFYGYGFGNDAFSDEWRYASILAKYPNQNAHNLDQIGSTIYYNGIPTVKQKTAFAKQNGGGVMVWELSNDTLDHPYSLLSAISETLLGINEKIPSLTLVNIYPNPVTTAFSIDGLPPFNKVSINVRDIMGREITSFNGYQEQYSLKQVPDGVYFVSILLDENERVNLKFIVSSSDK